MSILAEIRNNSSSQLQILNTTVIDGLKQRTCSINPKCDMKFSLNNETKCIEEKDIILLTKRSLWLFLTGEEYSKQKAENQIQSDCKLRKVSESGLNMKIKIQEMDSDEFIDQILENFQINTLNKSCTHYIGFQLAETLYFIKIQLVSKSLNDLDLTFTAWENTAETTTSVALHMNDVYSEQSIDKVSHQAKGQVVCRFCESPINLIHDGKDVIFYCPVHKYIKEKTSVIYKFVDLNTNEEVFICRNIDQLKDSNMRVCQMKSSHDLCGCPHSQFELNMLKWLKYLQQNGQIFETFASNLDLPKEPLREDEYFNEIVELHKIVGKGDVGELKCFIKHSEDDLLFNSILDNNTILYTALKHKQIEMIRFLLSDEIKLGECLQSKTLSSVKFQRFVNKKKENNHTLFSEFFEDIQENQILDKETLEIATIFLKCEYYDVNQEIGNGTTIVHEVIRKNQATLFDIIMERFDFEVRIVDRNGKSLADVLDPSQKVIYNKIISHLLSFDDISLSD